ncbi:MAG: GlsB/YeaQ/YmgE family stress response membrane protein [Planctomycetaceae bacterium]
MADSNLLVVAQQAAHELLVWVGFGTLVGLTAKAIMPGRDPGGAVGTLLMGIAGSLIGCGILLLFDNSYRITPISPLGFIAGTVGAFILLLFYRILSNSYIVEAADGSVPSTGGTTVTYYSRRRRRRAA